VWQAETLPTLAIREGVVYELNSNAQKNLDLLVIFFSMELCICSGWSDWIFSAWSAAGVHQAQQECQKGIFHKEVNAN
jgi:hypothetical protein